MHRSYKNQTLIVVVVLALSLLTACYPPPVKEADRPEQALIPCAGFILVLKTTWI